MNLTLKQNLQQLMSTAVEAHKSGRSQEAEGLYLKVLEIEPCHSDANHNLGIISFGAGNKAKSIELFKTAIRTNPHHQEYWLSYIKALINLNELETARGALNEAIDNGLSDDNKIFLENKITANTEIAQPKQSDVDHLISLYNTGDLSSAEKIARNLIKSFPGFPIGWKALGAIHLRNERFVESVDASSNALKLAQNDSEIFNNLGVALSELDNLNQAEIAFSQAIKINPNFAEAISNLARLNRTLKKYSESESLYNQAIKIKTNYSDAYAGLALVLKDLGRFDEAIYQCKLAINLQPANPIYKSNLGVILKECGRLNESIKLFKDALHINPNYVEAFNNLGNSLREIGLLSEAEDSYRKALSIKSNYPEALCNLGVTLKEQGRIAEAEKYFLASLAIKPDFALCHNNLAVTLKQLGRLKESENHYRRALDHDPNFAEAHSNLIFLLDLVHGVTVKEQQEERKLWGIQFGSALASCHRIHNTDPCRRLRIGYVSADFRYHSAANVFGTMLTAYDRSNFDVYAYHNHPKSDQITDIFKNSVSVWRQVYGMSDLDLVRQIVDDQIDILVDLSGHTQGNRLKVFANKPAPIQLSGWGYPLGTGLKQIDGILSDTIIIPKEHRKHYVEKIIDLPCVVSYFQPASFPKCSNLPALSNQTITFGSLNRIPKVTPECIKLWSMVLNAIPNSQILLKAGELDDTHVKEYLLNTFAESGIQPDRIHLIGKSSWLDHVDTYNQIDIALDPHPHGGGVTTLEALMMGVPVLTLKSDGFQSRLGTTILSTINLKDWIATSEEDYVEIALEKANNLQELSRLRTQLRTRLNKSVLCDHQLYARSVENHYRNIWQDWCKKF